MDRGALHHGHEDSGFTLTEVLIAAVLLIVGLLAVAYGVTLGLTVVSSAQDDTIARQKAREAMEDIFTARNIGKLSFDQICNIIGGGAKGGTPNCVFLDGFPSVPMATAGPDGLVNTADDGGTESYYAPGRDGVLGTTDDVQVFLTGFRRRIQITPITSILKQITVTVEYTTPRGVTRSVTLVAVMSPYV